MHGARQAFAFRFATIVCAALVLACLSAALPQRANAQDVGPAAAALAANAAAQPAKPATAADGGMTMDQFLDRLMRSESGGRALARNPRSTALGPFQFIASTWLMIANKHFEKETKDLRVDQVLSLRIDHELARRAAQIYTQTNAAFLAAQGHTATFPNLRLAFLVGPGGAARVLSAAQDTPVSTLLGASVIAANPFMARMTAADLVARAARDIAADPASLAGVTPDPALVREANAGASPSAAPKRARIAVPCSLALASCRRWLALAERRGTSRKQRRASR